MKSQTESPENNSFKTNENAKQGSQLSPGTEDNKKMVTEGVRVDKKQMGLEDSQISSFTSV